jgi:ABC-type glycerol-3-phosphate transport system substrate-binding protein
MNVCKKILSVLPVIVLILFAGCSQKKEHDKIRFVSLAWQEQSMAATKDIIKDWNMLNPGKEVEYVQANWASIYDYMTTSFETGDVPDIFHYEASMITDFGMRGNLTDLRPFIDDSLRNDIYPAAWESVTLNKGEVIGFPFVFESLIILYNKDIFEKENIILPPEDKPWTWEEFRDAAVKMTKDFNNDGKTDQWGAAIGLRNASSIILNLTLGFGGTYFYKENSEDVVKIGEPEKKLLTTIHDMIFKYKCIPPFAASQRGSDLIPSFFNGKYAMVLGIGTWARQQLVENAPQNFRWGVLQPLKAVTQDQGSNPQTLSIPVKSKRKKDAAEFIKFFISKANLPRLALSDWMNPTRISCRSLPEFSDEKNGWKTSVSVIDHLKMGPWVKVPALSEWKGRVATPLFQEYFSGRMALNDFTLHMQEESAYVLSRYKDRR